MKEKDILNQHDKHLVFLGASIASGCWPCTKYHVMRSLEAGFTDNEIDKIISMAITVRNMATRTLDSFVKNKFPELEPGPGIQETLSRDEILVDLAASFTVNFHPGFLEYKKLAQKTGFTEEELSEILKFSQAVSDKARSLLIE